MRIQLTLRPRERVTRIPINYQYPLSAAIYKILRQGSPEYAQWLHDQGYLSPAGRLMKLFTFSRLWIPRVRREGTILFVQNFARCTLLVSSPMLEDFVPHFVVGLFSTQEMTIGSREVVGRFVIEEVEAVPYPEFQPVSRFRCLSPIVVATKRDVNGEPKIYYYRPSDAELSEAIRQNLIQKYQIIFKKRPEDDRLIFQLDDEYVRRRGGYDRLSKLITLCEGDPRRETRIKAFESYFALEGSAELMHVAWECGIGDHNSQGFGMVEVVG